MSEKEKPANKKSNSPYRGNPGRTFWKTSMTGAAIEAIPDLYSKKFSIEPGDRISAAGSCFAQHIARHLRSNGYEVLDAEPAPPGISDKSAIENGYGIYSARFGNIYYTRQLVQLAREVLEDRTPGEIVWEKNGRFYDALRPSITAGGHATPTAVLAHRHSHIRAVRRLFEDTDVFVFTMGLTEGWELTSDGTAFPTAPGTVAGDYDPAKYEFKNYTYSEIVKDFLDFRILLRRNNPRVKFIITVSPVPLAATASGKHVLTATTYSKAVLRAAAGEIERRCADVDYFPSYEVVTANYMENEAFDDTGRNVRPEVVESVMEYFFAEHQPLGIPGQKGVPSVADETVFCDDALLEVFSE